MSINIYVYKYIISYLYYIFNTIIHIHTQTQTQATTCGHEINLAFATDYGNNNLLKQQLPALPHSCFHRVITKHFKVFIVKHTRHPSNKSSGAWKELISKFSSSSGRGSSLLLIAELHAVSLTPLKVILEMWLTSERV